MYSILWGNCPITNCYKSIHVGATDMKILQYKNSFGHTNNNWHRPPPDLLCIDFYSYKNKDYQFCWIEKKCYLESEISKTLKQIIFLLYSLYSTHKIYSKPSTYTGILKNALRNIAYLERRIRGNKKLEVA